MNFGAFPNDPGLGTSFLIAQTAAGAPTTGYWVAGSAIIDANGIVWKCTVTGTPGMWVQGASGAGGVTSFNGRVGAIVPTTGDYTVSQVTGAAPIASPTFTGVPAAPTPATADNSTTLATTAFVKAQPAPAAAVGFRRTNSIALVAGGAFSSIDGGNDIITITPPTGIALFHFAGTLNIVGPGQWAVTAAIFLDGVRIVTFPSDANPTLQMAGSTNDLCFYTDPFGGAVGYVPQGATGVNNGFRGGGPLAVTDKFDSGGSPSNTGGRPGAPIMLTMTPAVAHTIQVKWQASNLGGVGATSTSRIGYAVPV